MRFQKRTYSCGAAAIVNAARCFGVRVPEASVRKLSGTTPRFGTSEHGIMDALTALGFTPVPQLMRTRGDAMDWLRDELDASRVVVVCVDQWDHWALVVSRVGNRFVLVDSSNVRKNVLENGISCLSEAELSKRWKKKTQRVFYGISVGR